MVKDGCIPIFAAFSMERPWGASMQAGGDDADDQDPGADVFVCLFVCCFIGMVMFSSTKRYSRQTDRPTDRQTDRQVDR